MPSVRKIKRRMPHLNIAGELEALARKGWAVSLIYDDAGNWAFGTDGMQNCRQHGDDLVSSWWVKASDFKPSIQAAWNHFQKQRREA